MAFPANPTIPKTDDPAIDFLRESVTAGDVTSQVRNGVIHLMIPLGGDMWGNYGADQIVLTPNPPPFWTIQRDFMMRQTIHKESFWAGAIGIAISKIAAMGFEIKGDVPLRIKRGQEIMLYADGRQVGYVNFISKHLRDYLTTDNGSFFEVVRESAGPMSRVAGIRHLDSLRCIRTGDPLIPVIYRDRKNVYHELKYYEVIAIADMPDAGETFNGVGLCAASRAYYSIYKLASIEWYLREKVSGLQPLAIHIVNGILDQQLKDAVQAAKEGAIARGVIAHMGAVLIGIPAQEQPGVVTIPLAELPDGFERKTEFDLSILAYANAIGLDPQDLQPLTGAPLGSGMQTEILHEKSKGRGLAGWRPQFIHQINEFVLSQGTTFAFYDKDFRDLKSKADLSKALAETAAARIAAGITTAQEEKQILVDLDELPKEFIPEDQTAGETLSDTEKDDPNPREPVEGETPAAQPTPAPPEKAEEESGKQPGKTEKAFDYDDLVAELDSAQELYQLLEDHAQTTKQETAIFDYVSQTLKHLAGKHNQKRHSWRYGSNIPLSKLKRQRAGDDDSEWQEYKSRVRAKHGTKPAKTGKPTGKKTEPETPKKDPKQIFDEHVEKLWNQEYTSLGDSESAFNEHVTKNPAHQKWNDNLTSDERSAIKAYTDGAYSSMNKALREDNVNSDYNKFSGVTNNVNHMQTALNKSELTENTLLYRGFSSEKTTNMLKSGEYTKGSIFHDKGFMSTSTSSEFSSSWGSSGGNHILLKIKAPKGTKGGYMAFGLGIGGSTHEKEFVFPPGTAFHIQNITYTGGRYVLDIIPIQSVVNDITGK